MKRATVAAAHFVLAGVVAVPLASGLLRPRPVARASAASVAAAAVVRREEPPIVKKPHPPLAPPRALEPRESEALQQAGRRYARSVVTVDAYYTSGASRASAGVVASADGHIYAPLFLVDDAEFLIVGFGGDQRMPAEVLARDRRAQLAILKVASLPRGMEWPVLGLDEDQWPGSPVLFLTRGSTGLRTMPGTVLGPREEAGSLRDLLEVGVEGAPTTPGPLLNAEGRLVGLALARPDGAAGGKRLLVLPAGNIREAVDRITESAPGTEVDGSRTGETSEL